MTYGIPWNREAEAFPVGTCVRVTDGNTPTERAHIFAGAYGRVTQSAGRIVTVRFPGREAATFDADWLARVVYVRAEYLSPDSAGHGARIRVRERYLPRRQRTFPYPYADAGMLGDNAKAHCVGEFVRSVSGMMRPDISVAYERGRATMFAVTELGTCECSDEYGPCEFHAETIVTREGSSSRSADELVTEYLSDAVSVLGDYPSDDYREAMVRLGNALADSGGTWFENPDDAEEARDHVSTAEGALGTAGYSTYWDDGYRIVRITGGPFHDAP